MATIGVSKPYVAIYQENQGSDPTYTQGTLLAKMVDYSSDIDSGSDNNLYADNGIAESERGFAGGTMSITVDDLTQEASALILGASLSSVTIGGKEIKEIVYDDNMNAPLMGFGCIVKKKQGGAYVHRAVVLPKIMFSIPSEAATTQGETIEWQTPSLEATIMRDDSAVQRWMRTATFPTEAAAEAYIKSILNIVPVPDGGSV